MKSVKSNDQNKPSINKLLIVISLLVVGILGVLVVTQIEMVSGWANNEFNNKRPVNLYIVGANNNTELIVFSDFSNDDHLNDSNYYTNSSPNFGVIYSCNRITGVKIWNRELNGPIKRVFPIADVDNDNHQDFIVSYASMNNTFDSQYHYNEYEHLFGASLLNGSDGTFMTLTDSPMGDNENFTNEFMTDLVFFTNISNNIEDFIAVTSYENQTGYNQNVTGYFMNGTIKNTLNFQQMSKDLKIGIINNLTNDNLLIVGRDENYGINYYSLRDITSENYTVELYNHSFSESPPENFVMLGDLGDDGISEFIIAQTDGQVILINGSTGDQLFNSTEYKDASYSFNNLTILHKENSHIDMILDMGSDQTHLSNIFRLNSTTLTPLWNHTESSESEVYQRTMLLGDDINGDGYPDLMFARRERGLSQEFSQISYVSGSNGVLLYHLLGDQIPKDLDENYKDPFYPKGGFMAIPDIDGDGINDIAIAGDARVSIFSSIKPFGLWYNKAIPEGFIFFILFVIMIGGALAILIIKRKQFKFEAKKNIKRFKWTVIINAIVISLMFTLFIIFSFTLNVFNRTLLSNDPQSLIYLYFFTVNILWLGVLPVTAVLYNWFAPRSAFIFIKARDWLFKLTKNVDHDILVLKMDEKLELGMLQSLRRCILPILLSLTIGLFTYTTLAPILGYPISFSIFGGTEFFEFMNGYMLLGMLPMVLTFFIFFFFIPGSWLLDDAGIVYYMSNHKKDHIPGDIERVSVWQTAFITGFASFSSILTFINFMRTIDFSGFFTINPGQDLAQQLSTIIMGTLVCVVSFWGLPFLTGLAYMLLAIGAMESNIEANRLRLYNLMEKSGYEITPRELSNLYPEGFHKTKQN